MEDRLGIEVFPVTPVFDAGRGASDIRQDAVRSSLLHGKEDGFDQRRDKEIGRFHLELYNRLAVFYRLSCLYEFKLKGTLPIERNKMERDGFSPHQAGPMGDHERIQGIINQGVGLERVRAAFWWIQAVDVADENFLPGRILQVRLDLDGAGNLGLEILHLIGDEFVGFVEDFFRRGQRAIGGKKLTINADEGSRPCSGAAERVQDILSIRADGIKGAGEQIGFGIVIGRTSRRGRGFRSRGRRRTKPAQRERQSEAGGEFFHDSINHAVSDRRWKLIV